MSKHKLYSRNFFILLFSVCFPFLMTSCIDGPNDPQKHKGPAQSTLLIYAVATNSLTGNLVSDKNEMLKVAKDIDLSSNNVLIFETQYKYLEDYTRVGNVRLLKLAKAQDADGYTWETVKDFNDGVASLDPSRVSEIITYVKENFEAENYGLVFWSHSTASQPYFDDTAKTETYNINPQTYSVSLPMQYSFGQDLTVSAGDPYYQINVDVLADAIPDNMFNFIWFDSCYMSNIETIYQFRNKCKTYVGYPTEVLDDGLPYHYVLPYMVGRNPDLVHAAELFFNYYSNSFGTIAVVDTENLENLVDFCKGYYGKHNISSSSIMKYSRYSTGPFYDFGDYSKAMGSGSGNEIPEEEWNKILEQCVLYKATTSGSLLGLSIKADRFSGISTHLYSFLEEGSEIKESMNEKYYKSLDWYKAVFE